MKFEHPAILLLLLIVPFIFAVLIFALYRKNRFKLKLGEEKLIERLSSLNKKSEKIKALFIVLALVFFVISLARPKIGSKIIKARNYGYDVVMIVDTSKSMLASDLKPNRLEKAKHALKRLIQNLSGNRIGIIAFAGTAYWQCPLTTDTASLNMFLEIMDTNLIPLPGTNIKEALGLAENVLSKTAPKSKVIILMTDGESHEEGSIDAAKSLADNNIRVITVGFGSPGGEPIPMYDENGALTGYKKDKDGNVVVSKLDEMTLAKIADITKGKYFRADNDGTEVGYVLSEIKGLEKDELKSHYTKLYEERFQIPLFMGFLLLIINFMIKRVKKLG